MVVRVIVYRQGQVVYDANIKNCSSRQDAVNYVTRNYHLSENTGCSFYTQIA